MTTPSFSSNYNPDQGSKDIQPLLRSNGGKWDLIQSGKGLERRFRFKTFKKTWEFMNIIAAECAVKKHHPEWSNVYNTTFIRWTTHSPPGLSEKDVLMARYCDEQAEVCGEQQVEAVEPVEAVKAAEVVGGPGVLVAGGDLGKDLVDIVASAAGDCCVPKSQRKALPS